MVLLIIALLIAGFFFPPAWLGLVGYGIYIWASRKSRRNDAIEGRVKKMVSNGKNHAVFNDLYFEAARTYAIEKGAKAADSTSASAHILVGGKTYFVVFSKAAGGGTAFRVEDAQAARDRVFNRSKIEQFVATPPTRGSDLRYNIQVTAEEANTGKKQTIQYPMSVACVACSGSGSADCQTCHGTGNVAIEKTLFLDIPPGVQTGRRLRLSGKGDAGRYGGPAGDLYVFIEVKEHQPIERGDPNCSSNTFCVGGLTFSGDPSKHEVWAQIAVDVANRVQALALTELDIYRYLMEEADRMSQLQGLNEVALRESGIKPIEYEGEMAKAHKYPDNRSALDYLNGEVSPDLAVVLDEHTADKIRSMVFSYIVDRNAIGVRELRKKYAVHYANNCSANGNYGYAEKWDKLIETL